MIDRNEIFQYVKTKYDTKPEYLWEKYPKYAVLRHHDNGKWYAVIMDVSKEKLGLKGTGKVDILNIKNHPAIIGNLRKEQEVLPAYHMNKEHWVSIVLNGDFSKQELCMLIDISYEMTEK